MRKKCKLKKTKKNWTSRKMKKNTKNQQLKLSKLQKDHDAFMEKGKTHAEHATDVLTIFSGTTVPNVRMPKVWK